MKTKTGEKINFKQNFLEYFSYLKKYKFLCFSLILLVILSSSKGIVDNYFFKLVIDKGTEFSSGILNLPSFLKILTIIGVTYGLILIFNVIVTGVNLNFLNKLDVLTIRDLKKKYFEHILSLDYNFHTTHKTGSLISKLSRAGNAMERINDIFVYDLFPMIINMIIAISAFIYLDKISSLIICIVIFLFVSYSLIMQKRIENPNIMYNKIEDIEKGNTADFFVNLESIRNFGKEGYIKKKYRKLIENTKKNQLLFWNSFVPIVVGQFLILGIGTFVLIYFSIKGFLNGKITLGTLAFVYTTYLTLIDKTSNFVNGIRGISRNMADFQELFNYGKIKNAIKDDPDAKQLEIKKGEIVFKNVYFNYGKRKIFEDFNLKINPNEKVAFVGHSGSGKTTLIRLLYRLYDIDSGEILCDNKNIKEIKQEFLRSELSIVPQECILFDDTIFNNVHFSKPDASKEEVMKAIKFSQLNKVIDNLPKKEKTIVGERGVKLSGGEKQRVSIARAILADKKVLILDEATSSLDSETEHEIQRDLQKLLQGRTSIIIAHRLSTIMNADKIIVLKKGKIVQIGKHNKLIKEKGEYKHLWNLQKGGYIK